MCVCVCVCVCKSILNEIMRIQYACQYIISYTVCTSVLGVYTEIHNSADKASSHPCFIHGKQHGPTLSQQDMYTTLYVSYLYGLAKQDTGI